MNADEFIPSPYLDLQSSSIEDKKYNYYCLFLAGTKILLLYESKNFGVSKQKVHFTFLFLPK